MARSPFRWSSRREIELLLDDEEDSAQSSDLADGAAEDADERGFVAVSGGSWERRLSRREKTLRGAGSAVVALVILVAVLGGPGAVLSYLAKVTLSLAPAPVAKAAAPNASDALDVPVPANIAENPLISLTPVNGADAAYACWIDEATGLVGKAVAPLHLAEYVAASHNWTTVMPPVAQAASCKVVTDETVPGHMALALAHANADGGPCQLPDLYESADAGAHWATMPWPTGALAPCGLRFEMEDGRFYVEGGTRLLPSAGAGWIAVTADGGVTWAAADAGLAALSQVSLVAVRPGGRLLAQGDDPQRQGSATLWQSVDAGAHWRFVVAVPGAEPQVYASSDPQETSNGGWGRFYVYTGTATDGSLRGLTGASVDTASDASLLMGFAEPQWAVSSLQPNGATLPRWSSVPLPAGAPTPDTRPAGMWLSGASEGPSGSMIFTRPDAANVIAVITLPIDLLLWNGTTWGANSHVIPANANLQGVTWDHGVMRVWLTHKAGILRPVQMFTFTISPGDVG